MALLVKNAQVLRDGAVERADLLVEDGRIAAFGFALPVRGEVQTLAADDCFLFPGFTDVHVHLREPGFSYKETIATGTAAAAHGGYTHVCAMPNLDPVPDDGDHLAAEEALIARDAVIAVHPYGAVTVGERGEQLADMAALASRVVAFSDDGRGVQSETLMRAAMERAAACGRVLAAHCEDNALLRGGYIHDGRYAAAHGHRGICSESEWGPIARDLRLARETGCAYHVCHVSTKESVALIREAKRQGVDVTCETAPHYLLLCEDDLQEDGRFKMNPPLRSAADRDALVEGLLDGTIDMIATDHAPHAAAEKARGLEHSAMGVVGLETAFAALYTGLVRPGVLPLGRLIDALTVRPAARFGVGTPLRPGQPADFTLFDLAATYTVDPARFLSKGRSTPFAGRTLHGVCRYTFKDGRPVWSDAERSTR